MMDDSVLPDLLRNTRDALVSEEADWAVGAHPPTGGSPGLPGHRTEQGQHRAAY